MRGRGFALVETLLALAVLATALMGLATSTTASHTGARDLETKTLLDAHARRLEQQLTAVPFGEPTDPPATGAELEEFFDGDDVFGTITLFKLRAFGAAEFELRGLAVPGRWRVVVDQDIDEDGTTAGADDGRNDLLRVRILFDDQLRVRSIRFAEEATP